MWSLGDPFVDFALGSHSLRTKIIPPLPRSLHSSGRIILVINQVVKTQVRADWLAVIWNEQTACADGGPSLLETQPSKQPLRPTKRSAQQQPDPGAKRRTVENAQAVCHSQGRFSWSPARRGAGAWKAFPLRVQRGETRPTVDQNCLESESARFRAVSGHLAISRANLSNRIRSGCRICDWNPEFRL